MTRKIRKAPTVIKPTVPSLILTLPPDESGASVGTLRIPYNKVMTQERLDMLTKAIIPLVMVFRELIMDSIEIEDFNPIGHGLGDLVRVVKKRVPSMKSLFLEIIQAIGNKIKESDNNDYTRGLDDAGKLIISVFNQIYEEGQMIQ